MGMISEFKAFAMRGNVIDMAVGVIIGSAFGKITKSLVNDVIMPPIGMLLGKIDFASLAYELQPAVLNGQNEVVAEAVNMNIGLFINTIIDFMIVAFVVFFVIKQMNRLKDEEPAKAPATKACTFCQSDISIKATRCPNCTSQLEAG